MHDEDKEKEIDETSSSHESVNNLDLAVENLTTDTGFSVEEIPLIQPHEILIPPVSDHLPSNSCSPSSTPSTSTKHTSSSTINLMNENLKSLQYWHSKYYNENMHYSDEGDFTYWDWLPESASY